LDASTVKTVFSGGSRVIREFLEWLVGLGAKDRGSCKFWGFFGDFVEFWGVWSGLGSICKYFLETEGPAERFTSVQGPQQNLQQRQGLCI
jgi:hypothetical protein